MWIIKCPQPFKFSGIEPTRWELAKISLWRPPMAVPWVCTQVMLYFPDISILKTSLIPIPPATPLGARISHSLTRTGSEHHWFYHRKINWCETQTDQSLKTKLVPSSPFEIGRLLFILCDWIKGIAQLAIVSWVCRHFQWGWCCMSTRHWTGVQGSRPFQRGSQLMGRMQTGRALLGVWALLRLCTLQEILDSSKLGRLELETNANLENKPDNSPYLRGSWGMTWEGRI